MLQSNESETEILLGNKQLLGIFLVVALLLGIAFTGGFLVGRGGAGKKVSAQESASASTPSGAVAASGSGGQTHTLEGDTTLPAAASGGADAEAATPPRTAPEALEGSPRQSEGALGSRRSAKSPLASKASVPDSDARRLEPESDYLPRSGSTYLQVAAVGKDEAETVADVLHKKGFHAHAVPKPGSAKIYRVIIGPVKDAGDLSSTRDALRKTFREVIVQRY